MSEQLLAEYYDKLAKHDWFHNYSDSNAVMERGAQVQRVLAQDAHNGEAFLDLYKAFNDYKFHDGLKPERPTGPKPIIVDSCFKEIL
jgi:hypothetical protein